MSPPPQWTSEDYASVVAIAHAASGLAIGETRRFEAEFRIRQAMQDAGMTDIGCYRELVETDQVALDALISELSVGETYFFRDPQHFQFVRHTVLPEVRKRRGPQHVVRAWSAGCSTGEEAYSLAILFEQERMVDRSNILATDISRPALEGLRRARYRPWAMRGMDPAIRDRYFSLCAASGTGEYATQYELVEHLRQRVVSDYLNLSRDTYPSLFTGTAEMDLIFCRNVLIYFDPQTIAAVVRRLALALSDGGWLVLGPSDPMVPDDVGLESRSTDWGLFYRRMSEAEARARPPRAVVAAPVKPTPARVPAQPAIAGPHAIQPSAPPEAKAVPPPQTTPLSLAQAAFQHGDYQRAASLACALPDGVGAAALHASALANIDLPAAELLCAEATARYAASVELHHLHAALLIGLGRYGDAARAAARVVYLDRGLAAGHFMLASVLRFRGDRAGARRAYRNAQALCAASPGDEIVPFCEGARADTMVAVAAREIRQLDAGAEGAT